MFLKFHDIICEKYCKGQIGGRIRVNQRYRICIDCKYRIACDYSESFIQDPDSAKIVLQEKRGLKGDLILSMIFAGLIILSTCIGVKITSYSLNTRVIGAMSAGLLGGPLVGLYSSAIGAIYVLIFSTPRAFARGSAFATILFGLLGAGFYPYFQRGKWKYTDLFLLACFAEICDMGILLRMTVSLEVAVDTIVDAALPNDYY